MDGKSTDAAKNFPQKSDLPTAKDYQELVKELEQLKLSQKKDAEDINLLKRIIATQDETISEYKKKNDQLESEKEAYIQVQSKLEAENNLLKQKFEKSAHKDIWLDGAKAEYSKAREQLLEIQLVIEKARKMELVVALSFSEANQSSESARQVDPSAGYHVDAWEKEAKKAEKLMKWAKDKEDEFTVLYYNLGCTINIEQEIKDTKDVAQLDSPLINGEVKKIMHDTYLVWKEVGDQHVVARSALIPLLNGLNHLAAAWGTAQAEWM